MIKSNKKSKEIFENDIVYYSVLFILLFTFFILHIYKINEIPAGINIDEMGMGYDAWSIANFGVDRYQNSFPVYLINFGFGQSVLYCYLAAIFIKLFGLNIITMRLPAMIFSVLTLIYIIKIIKLRYGDNRSNTILAFSLYIIFPYFMLSSRFGLDCNLMLGMSTIFIYYLLKAIETKSNKNYLFAGVMCGLILYTYILSYIAIPIFLLLTIIYLIYLKKITFKNFCYFTIPLFILAIPLLLTQLVNYFGLESFKIGIFTIPKMFGYRANEFGFGNLIETVKTLFKAIFLYDGIPYNSMEKFGSMYHISIPFVVGGIIICCRNLVVSLKSKGFQIDAIIFFWFLSVFFLGFILNGYSNANRINGIYFALLYFIYIAFKTIIASTWRFKSVVLTFVMGVYLVLFMNFVPSYFKSFKEMKWLFNKPSDTFDLINSDKTTFIDLNYIYTLAHYRISPFSDEGSKLVYTFNYKNLYFYVPEEVDESCDYVIENRNEYFKQKLLNEGFDSMVIDDNYTFYSKNQ